MTSEYLAGMLTQELPCKVESTADQSSISKYRVLMVSPISDEVRIPSVT